MQDVAISSYRSKLANAIKIMVAHGIDLEYYNRAIQDDLLADAVLYCAKNHNTPAMTPLELSRNLYSHAEIVLLECTTNFKRSDELFPEVAQFAANRIAETDKLRYKVRTDAVDIMRDVIERTPDIKLLFP